MQRWRKGVEVLAVLETSWAQVVVLPTPGVPVMTMLGRVRMLCVWGLVGGGSGRSGGACGCSLTTGCTKCC